MSIGTSGTPKAVSSGGASRGASAETRSTRSLTKPDPVTSSAGNGSTREVTQDAEEGAGRTRGTTDGRERTRKGTRKGSEGRCTRAGTRERRKDSRDGRGTGAGPASERTARSVEGDYIY